MKIHTVREPLSRISGIRKPPVTDLAIRTPGRPRSAAADAEFSIWRGTTGRHRQAFETDVMRTVTNAPRQWTSKRCPCSLSTGLPPWHRSPLAMATGTGETAATYYPNWAASISFQPPAKPAN